MNPQLEKLNRLNQQLWDYIDSLEPGRRERAVQYQRELEELAATLKGGMAEAICIKLRQNNEELIGISTRVMNVLAGRISSSAVEKAAA